MPIRYIREAPNPNDVEGNLEKLATEFPDWDFWWSPSFGVKYCAGRKGEIGSINHDRPEGVAEQIRKGEEQWKSVPE